MKKIILILTFTTLFINAIELNNNLQRNRVSFDKIKNITNKNLKSSKQYAKHIPQRSCPKKMMLPYNFSGNAIAVLNNVPYNSYDECLYQKTETISVKRNTCIEGRVNGYGHSSKSFFSDGFRHINVKKPTFTSRGVKLFWKVKSTQIEVQRIHNKITSCKFTFYISLSKK